MKQARKPLLVGLSLVLVAALAAGLTLAYLKDTDSDVNVMTMGNVSIRQNEEQRVDPAKNGTLTNADIESFEQAKPLYPYVDENLNGAMKDDYEEITFPNGKTHKLFIGDNAIDKLVSVTNTGKTNAYVRTIIALEAPTDKIDLSFNSTDWTMDKTASSYSIEVDGVKYDLFACVYKEILKPNETTPYSLLQIALDGTATNEDVAVYGKTYDVLVLSQAVQAEGFEDAAIALDTAFGKIEATSAAEWFGGIIAEHSADTWDGTADTSWYNDTDTEFALDTAEQLAGLAELVDGGNNFAGKTIKLERDFDLASLPFNPIGHSSNGKSFNGTFDGQGHTISNMYEQSNLDSNNGGWKYEGEYYGLFAYTNGATVKNVTIADAYISSGRNEAAGVVGNATDTSFSDITIANTTLIAYNNSAGGVAAECYGNCSFTNIVVDEDTVIGPLWGTYDVRLGGVVGLVHAGNNVTFSNITVACQLDAINDVAANYQYWLYRYSGMLIGHVDGVNGVADPTGYVTCENVTVIYNDWVNYHYCEDADLGAGSYNGPGEYKYARVEAGTGTDGIDLSTCNHNADESHNVLIVFDQLFGGGQGISGLKTYDGVTVIYNNH